MKPDITTLQYWRSRVPELPDFSIMRSGTLSASTPLIFTAVTAPLPCGSYVAAWEWFDSMEHASSYVHHILLRQLFETWLCRAEWDDSCNELITVDELLHRAEKAEAFVEDLPLMRQLEQVAHSANTRACKDAIGLLQGMAERFNRRWRSTPSWNLELRIYKDPVQAGEALWQQRKSLQHDDLDAFDHEQWLALCGSVGQDAATTERVMEIFKDSSDT